MSIYKAHYRIMGNVLFCVYLFPNYGVKIERSVGYDGSTNKANFTKGSSRRWIASERIERRNEGLNNVFSFI